MEKVFAATVALTWSGVGLHPEAHFVLLLFAAFFAPKPLSRLMDVEEMAASKTVE